GLLFAFIYFYEWQTQRDPSPSATIVPGFKPVQVQAIQVRPPGPSKLEIRAERTNSFWWLTEPMIYPGQSASIEALIQAIQALAPAAHISPAELRARPNADEEYGFSSPQAGSVILTTGSNRIHLLLGIKTAPGDQLFLQVVGREGVYVVDADLLKLVPRSVDDWRDTRLLNLRALAFNRLTVKHGPNVFELQRDSQAALWRMLRPYQARANHAKIEQALERLNDLQVKTFISDASALDLEPFGLHQPELELSFLGQGGSTGAGLDTNVLSVLQFGKSPTNDPSAVFARVPSHGTIVTVPKDALASWRASVYDFRDPHLISVTQPIGSIVVRGTESFMLERHTNAWRVMPENLPADTALVEEFLGALTSLRIAQFVKDAVIESDLPTYGLAPPARQYILQTQTAGPTGSNAVELNFGFSTNANGTVFARCAGESFVYGVSTSEFERLPRAGWQLRDRNLCRATEQDVARVTVRQQGRTRELLRKGSHDWSLAPGSQGIIDDLAIEETVRGLLRAGAVTWVACGESCRNQFGFVDSKYELAVSLHTGPALTIQFGGEAPSGNVYAGTVLDGQFRVLEFSWLVYRDLVTYLSAP
ncbi:MAG TPA: DUF4340 domain-containing protein, partial [Clostridia bacterium]|nr:DUF4340 domain-containing protein [Clostridia bacterium]